MMATFQFSDHSVHLDFCGELKYSLPLDQETAGRLRAVGKKMQADAQAVQGKDDTPEALERLCDSVMDAIDEVLGEGAADQIAALKPDFGFWDALEVFQYISDEFNRATTERAAQFTKSRPAPVPSNRAQRRTAAQAKVTAIHGA